MQLINLLSGEVLSPSDRPRLQRLKPNPKGNRPFGTLVGVSSDGMLHMEFEGGNIIKVSASHYGLKICHSAEVPSDTA